MKEITIRDITGKWNEKIYSHNRIYVDNQEIFLTEEEKQELLTSPENNLSRPDAYKNVRTLIKSFSSLDQLKIIKDLCIDVLGEDDLHEENETILMEIIKKFEHIYKR